MKNLYSDEIFDYLGGLGYTGNFNDRLYASLVDELTPTKKLQLMDLIRRMINEESLGDVKGFFRWLISKALQKGLVMVAGNDGDQWFGYYSPEMGWGDVGTLDPDTIGGLTVKLLYSYASGTEGLIGIEFLFSGMEVLDVRASGLSLYIDATEYKFGDVAELQVSTSAEGVWLRYIGADIPEFVEGQEYIIGIRDSTTPAAAPIPAPELTIVATEGVMEAGADGSWYRGFWAPEYGWGALGTLEPSNIYGLEVLLLYSGGSYLEMAVAPYGVEQVLALNLSLYVDGLEIKFSEAASVYSRVEDITILLWQLPVPIVFVSGQSYQIEIRPSTAVMVAEAYSAAPNYVGYWVTPEYGAPLGTLTPQVIGGLNVYGLYRMLNDPDNYAELHIKGMTAAQLSALNYDLIINGIAVSFQSGDAYDLTFEGDTAIIGWENQSAFNFVAGETYAIDIRPST